MKINGTMFRIFFTAEVEHLYRKIFHKSLLYNVELQDLCNFPFVTYQRILLLWKSYLSAHLYFDSLTLNFLCAW